MGSNANFLLKEDNIESIQRNGCERAGETMRSRDWEMTQWKAAVTQARGHALDRRGTTHTEQVLAALLSVFPSDTGDFWLCLQPSVHQYSTENTSC